MAIFQAEAVDGLEFLHRVFGAAGTFRERLRQARGGSLEIASGASRPDRFFHTSPQKERESLYLSLSFVEALSRLVLPRIESLRHPDLGLSPEAVRIAFAPRFSCLPLLWTFEIAWIGGAPGEPAGFGIAYPEEAPFYGLFSLGILQCGALMARRHPTPETLEGAVGALVRQIAGQGAEPRGTEDLFRLTAGVPGEAWPDPEEALCVRAFQLGVDLAVAGLSGEFPPRDRFLGRLEALKAEAWRGLFEIAVPPEREVEREEDAAIHAMLMGLMARWEQVADIPAAAEDLERTMALGVPAAPAAEDLERTVALEVPAAPAAEDLERTVALGVPAAPAAEDLERTVALGVPAASAAEDLERTVALDPASGGRHGSLPPDAEDGLPETIAPGRIAVPEGKRPSETGPEADNDIVVETVILRPTGRSDRRRGG